MHKNPVLIHLLLFQKRMLFLFSYYYLSQNNKIYNRLLKNKDNFRSILIASGAHTFHTAKNLDFKKLDYQEPDYIAYQEYLENFNIKDVSE